MKTRNVKDRANILEANDSLGAESAVEEDEGDVVSSCLATGAGTGETSIGGNLRESACCVWHCS